MVLGRVHVQSSFTRSVAGLQYTGFCTLCNPRKTILIFADGHYYESQFTIEIKIFL